MIEPILLTLLATSIAAILVFAAKRYPTDEGEVVNAINNCLPQTQCAQCGHPGCLPYARAIANGEPINRCPPGGEQTIVNLANLLGRDVTPLDPEFGEDSAKTVAVIREAECIGCTLCIQACPVDAIVGAQQQMHSVIESVCTGCDLCLPPCPVDCIDMIELPTNNRVTPPEPATMECIRCGDCEDVCPKSLQPQALYWQRASNESMLALNLTDCIECRLCDKSCPSDIPLTHHFQFAKQSLKIAEQERTEAEQAESRYLDRQDRLDRSTAKVQSHSSADDRAALLARLGQSGSKP